MRHSTLVIAINAMGLSLAEFSEQYMGLKTPTFRYRMEHGCLRLDDYHRVLKATGKKWEELFPEKELSRPTMQMRKTKAVFAKPPVYGSPPLTNGKSFEARVEEEFKADPVKISVPAVQAPAKERDLDIPDISIPLDLG